MNTRRKRIPARTKFKKTVFFLTAFIIICFTLSNRAAFSQAISPVKETYYLGDTIQIRYESVPGDKDERGFYTGIAYWLSVDSAEGNLARRNFPGSESHSGVWEIETKDVFGGWIARDLTVTLKRRDRSDETLVMTKHFRLRQPKYGRLPGALSLRGGPRFKPGDPIIADLNLPTSFKIPDVDDRGNLTIYHFHVELHYLNRQTHGGAIQPDQRIHSNIFLEDTSTKYRVESHRGVWAVSKESEWLMPPLRPGMYEIRLFQKSGYTDYSASYSEHYVVDSVRFEIVHEYWPKSLRVDSPDDLKVGDEIKVNLDSVAVPFKDFASSSLKDRLEVHMYKVVDNIESVGAMYRSYRVFDGAYLQHISKGDQYTAGQDFIFMPVKQAGKYVILLNSGRLLSPLYKNDNYQAFAGYTLDHLKIDVARKKEEPPSYSETEKEMFKQMKKRAPSFEPPPPSAEPTIRTGNRFRFIPGEKVPVEVFMPSEQNPGAKTYLALKHRTADTIYENGEPMGKQIKEWEIEAGKKKAWTLPGDLAVGSYDLVLKSKYVAEWDGKEHTGVASGAGFQVVPKFNTVKIDIHDKRTFQYGEIITFDALFPGALDAKKFELQYRIFRKGGFVPGCAKTHDYQVEYGDIENGPKNVSFLAPPPGKYVLQVSGAHLDQIDMYNPIVLAEENFTSDLQWQPQALSFPSNKTEFPFGEEIHLAVDAHTDVGMENIESQNQKRLNETGKYMLYLYRQGDVSYGGAGRLPKTGFGEAYVEQAVAAQDNFILKEDGSTAWPFPGAYEFRLYNKRNDSDESYVVSRLPFYITEPGSPFPVEKGKPGSPRLSDLETQGISRGLRVGDYLGLDDCQDGSLEPVVEKMDLKFVSFKDGAYVDVTGAIDFGAGFYVQGKLEEEALQDSYIVTLITPEGDQQEVALFPLEDDPTIVRSERVYLIWHPEEEVSE